MPSIFPFVVVEKVVGKYFFLFYITVKNIHILVPCTIIGELEYTCINSIKEHFKIHSLPSLHKLSLLRIDLQVDRVVLAFI